MSDISISSLGNRNTKFEEEMQKLKSPFMSKIKSSTETFLAKIKSFEQKLQPHQQEDEVPLAERENQRVSQAETEENVPVTDLTGREKAPPDTAKKQSALSLKEWKVNKGHSFNNMEDAKESYINVFHKKLSANKKKNLEKCYDFKDDEKKMLKAIFQELKQKQDSKFVAIEAITKFLEENEMFYLFYNIDPSRLKYILKEFARTRSDSLTEVEFLLALFMERPLVLTLKDQKPEAVQRQCVLEAQAWNELKEIFNTLDTFGNEIIHIKPFFQKLKVNHSNPHLIYSPAIEFPEIGRVYNLRKLVYDLEHKYTFSDKVEWKDIEKVIVEFEHKEEPTMDRICEEHLEQCHIQLDSNYFLIDRKAIQILKLLFERCPKYCEFFANTKFLCNELLESQELKAFFRSPIRERVMIGGGYIDLEEAIRIMASKAPPYVDMDEFLEFFSIKGAVTSVGIEEYDEESSSDEEHCRNIEERKLLRKIRSAEKLKRQRKNRAGKKPPRQVTEFKEFGLTKKQKETIREKKVKLMIEERQKQELKELNAKFRANPIPADLNPERLRQQQKKNQLLKKKRLQIKAKQKQEDKELLSYLKANTKLFEEKMKASEDKENAKHQSEHQVRKFTHKPVPWFVQQSRLEEIERQKKSRARKIHEEAKIRYTRSWNQLPDFFFEADKNTENSIVQDLTQRRLRSPQTIRHTPVPDFHSLHQEFEGELEKRKAAFKPTKIEEFKLTEQTRSNTQHLNCVSPPSKKSRGQSSTKWRQTLKSPPSHQIFSTKKTEDWMRLNEIRKLEKEKEKEILKVKEKERILKQKNFARFMSSRLKMQQEALPNLEAQTAQKLKRYRETVKYLSRENERELSEIYARVLQRPFLFEIAAGDSQSAVGSLKRKKQSNKMKKVSKKRVIKSIEPIEMKESNVVQEYYSPQGQQQYPQFQSHQEGGYQDDEEEEEGFQQQPSALNQSF